MVPKPRARVLPVLLFAALLAHAQPAMEWQHPLGGTSDEVNTAIQQTTDGGYIMAGYAVSNDGDVSGNHGGSLYGDAWVVKLDSSGTLQWQRALGGTGDDLANAIQQTTDGGYIMAGMTGSNDGDVSGNHGGGDAWVVKLDGNGILQWQHALGGTVHDVAGEIQQTADGGYIMAGNTNSNDGDVSGFHGGGLYNEFGDAWVVKLDGSGTLQWQYTLGGTEDDLASSIQQTTDGGYIMAGYTISNDGDVSGNHGGGDAWVVKLDGNGILQWQRALGGTEDDVAAEIHQTTDGGYIMAGYAYSMDGDVSGNHGGNVHQDAWLVKLGGTGDIQWHRALGGTASDVAFSVQQTTDGGYITAGLARSNDGDVSGHHEGAFSDAWVVKVGDTGTLQWQRALGGTGFEALSTVQQTTDGGYITAGRTSSNDGDVSGNHGGSSFGGDAWVVKLRSEQSGIAEQQAATRVALYPNPTMDEVHVQIQLSNAVPVAMSILDAAGRIVGTYPEEHLAAGAHELSYSLNALPPGVYELRLWVNGQRVARKVVKR